MSKRYMLLCGTRYYPGGFDDFHGMYDDLEEATKIGEAYVKSDREDHWYQIFDTVEEKEAGEG